MKHRPHHLNPCLESARVILAYRDFLSLGSSHAGLGVSAAYTAKTLRHHGVWAEVWPVKSASALRQKLADAMRTAVSQEDTRPTHVILAAPWLATSEVATMAAEFPDIEFVVVSHSTVGFLSADPQAIRLLRETVDLQVGTHNVFVGSNSKKFTAWATEAWNVNAVYLPNLYYLSERTTQPKRPWLGTPLRIGIFGANRPLKNFLSGAAAAVQMAANMQVPTELFLSTGRTEGGSVKSLQELTEDIPNFKLTDTPWKPWPQFRRFVRTMDLIFQVSYTETFNVVTADAIAEGVPVVGSDAIDWLPRHWQAKADEPVDIARVAESLLRDPNVLKAGRQALSTYVDLGVHEWMKFLFPARHEKVKR